MHGGYLRHTLRDMAVLEITFKKLYRSSERRATLGRDLGSGVERPWVCGFGHLEGDEGETDAATADERR